MSILDRMEIVETHTTPENNDTDINSGQGVETEVSNEPTDNTTTTIEAQGEPSASEGNHQSEERAGEEPFSRMQFATEEVAELNAFMLKNPNKTIDDYKQLKKPTSEINEDDLLRQYYSEKEGMGEAEIALKMKKMELAKQSDDDFDDFERDDEEQLERQVLREKELKSARKWRDEYVREQLSETKTAEVPVEHESVEAYKKAVEEAQKTARQSYLTSLYTEVLPSITSIELGTNGESLSYIPDEEFKQEMKAVSEDFNLIYQKFLNQDGTFKDAKGFITEVALWANPTTREKMIAYRVEQAVLRDRASQSKVRRNVGFDSGGSEVATSESNADYVRKFFKEKSKKSW